MLQTASKAQHILRLSQVIEDKMMDLPKWHFH